MVRQNNGVLPPPPRRVQHNKSTCSDDSQQIMSQQLFHTQLATNNSPQAPNKNVNNRRFQGRLVNFFEETGYGFVASSQIHEFFGTAVFIPNVGTLLSTNLGTSVSQSNPMLEFCIRENEDDGQLYGYNVVVIGDEMVQTNSVQKDLSETISVATLFSFKAGMDELSHNILSKEFDWRLPKGCTLFSQDMDEELDLWGGISELYKIGRPICVAEKATKMFRFYQNLNILCPGEPEAADLESWLSFTVGIIQQTLSKIWFENHSEKLKETTELAVFHATGFSAQHSQYKISFHFVWPELHLTEETAVEIRLSILESLGEFEGSELGENSWEKMFEEWRDELRMCYCDSFNLDTSTPENRPKKPLGLFKVDLREENPEAMQLFSRIKSERDMSMNEWLKMGSIRLNNYDNITESCIRFDDSELEEVDDCSDFGNTINKSPSEEIISSNNLANQSFGGVTNTHSNYSMGNSSNISFGKKGSPTDVVLTKGGKNKENTNFSGNGKGGQNFELDDSLLIKGGQLADKLLNNNTSKGSSNNTAANLGKGNSSSSTSRNNTIAEIKDMLSILGKKGLTSGSPVQGFATKGSSSSPVLVPRKGGSPVLLPLSLTTTSWQPTIGTGTTTWNLADASISTNTQNKTTRNPSEEFKVHIAHEWQTGS